MSEDKDEYVTLGQYITLPDIIQLTDDLGRGEVTGFYCIGQIDALEFVTAIKAEYGYDVSIEKVQYVLARMIPRLMDTQEKEYRACFEVWRRPGRGAFLATYVEMG